MSTWLFGKSPVKDGHGHVSLGGGYLNTCTFEVVGSPTLSWEVKTLIFVFLALSLFEIAAPSMLKHAILSGENKNFKILIQNFGV